MADRHFACRNTRIFRYSFFTFLCLFWLQEVYSSKEIPQSSNNRDENETSPRVYPEFEAEPKRAAESYSFGLGKKNTDYLIPETESAELSNDLSSYQTEVDLSKSKRDGNFERFGFGLGKKAIQTHYAFGLGKRETPFHIGFEKGFDDKSMLEMDPDRKEPVNEPILFDSGKRRAEDSRFAFGLGKRGPEERFAFGSDKRGHEDRFAFGLGKRVPNEERFAFGLGKRGPEDRFSELGKRSAEDSRFAFGFGKRSSEENRFAFGLGKRDEVDDRFGFGLGQKREYDNNFANDFGKRSEGHNRFAFGVGKRENDHDRFAFGLGKKNDLGPFSSAEEKKNRFEFIDGKRVDFKTTQEIDKRETFNDDIDEYIKRRFSFGLGKRSIDPTLEFKKIP